MLDAYERIAAIIDSCKTHFQLECCNNLIDLFIRMYSQEENINEMHQRLAIRLEDKNFLFRTPVT